eukprot:2300061-Rhodomonas_salina.2
MPCPELTKCMFVCPPCTAVLLCPHDAPDAMFLCPCYALSGTDKGYCGTIMAMFLRACYALSGTDTGYGDTRTSRLLLEGQAMCVSPSLSLSLPPSLSPSLPLSLPPSLSLSSSLPLPPSLPLSFQPQVCSRSAVSMCTHFLPTCPRSPKPTINHTCASSASAVLSLPSLTHALCRAQAAAMGGNAVLHYNVEQMIVNNITHKMRVYPPHTPPDPSFSRGLSGLWKDGACGCERGWVEVGYTDALPFDFLAMCARWCFPKLEERAGACF